MTTIKEQRAAIDQSLKDMFDRTNKSAEAPRGHEVVPGVVDIQTQQINAMAQARRLEDARTRSATPGLPTPRPERPR
jgi:hypothetical protein